jgi:hypothetical protein
VNEARAASAQRIGELAIDPRFDGRKDDLESLATALGDESNTSWTGVDLLAAFPAEASISIGHRQVLERALGVLAGVSVFLPVGWTWFSLHSATLAYNDLLAAGQENGRTFLAMWTQGFDGRLGGSHRLVTMALVSFVLILFAVGCIVLHRLAAEINVHKEDNAARTAHRDLVTALLTAQRLLNQRRSDDPRFLEAAVERSVKELNKAHLATRKGIEALQTATQAGVDKINEAGAQLTGAMAPLLASATTASTNLAASAASAADAEKQISNSVAEVKSGLANAMEQFGSAVTGNTTELTAQTTAALGTLAANVEQIATVHAELTREVASAGQANRTASAETAEVGRRATAALADASKASIAHLASSSKASLADLAEVVQGLQGVLDSHRDTIQNQTTELSRAADLSGQILAELRLDLPQMDGVVG